MPSALAFIGGGLLQGAGKGLALQGREKRAEALKQFGQYPDLENGQLSAADKQESFRCRHAREVFQG